MLVLFRSVVAGITLCCSMIAAASIVRAKVKMEHLAMVEVVTPSPSNMSLMSKMLNSFQQAKTIALLFLL